MILHNNLKRSALAFAALLALMPLAVGAQTRVNMPKNKYKVQEDVKLGNQAAQQVEKQFPILNDSQAEAYVSRVGERLVAAIPQQFRQPAFDYSFKVVNASDINAFALPGGPMFVNRGMIEAAQNEGEMAGVMAHEIAHVALRHATAQATKQGSWQNQLGTIGLILGGAVLAGETGAQLGALGAAAWQTKYSREYETQADILGARIMADAGYDPRDLANMFRTIEKQGGSRGPEWLSSHPDPGNRYEKINREAAMLDVDPTPIKMTRDFERIQARLRALPPARTMAQIQQDPRNSEGPVRNPTAGGTYSRNVPFPSSRMRVYDGGDLRMRVPSNWREFGGDGSLIFAPEGAYGDQGITHGLMVGAYRSTPSGMLASTRNYVGELLQGNSYLSQRNDLTRTRVGGREAYTTTLSGRSPVTGRDEVVTVYTVQLRSGNLLTIAAVSAEADMYRYNSAFRNIINSIQLMD
ncbi:MAG: M48 family metalloprotease [Acidobacteria bacterium]|nr:M48 family metalloprotease [Acidobacteriota bacterium]